MRRLPLRENPFEDAVSSGSRALQHPQKVVIDDGVSGALCCGDTREVSWTDESLRHTVTSDVLRVEHLNQLGLQTSNHL